MPLHFVERHFAVIDKVLSGEQINEFGLTENGFLVGWGTERAKSGGGWSGNPVPAKWLILLIPQISNVRS